MVCVIQCGHSLDVPKIGRAGAQAFSIRMGTCLTT